MSPKSIAPKLAHGAVLALSLTGPALAQSAGDWTGSVGLGLVAPKSTNAVVGARVSASIITHS